MERFPHPLLFDDDFGRTRRTTSSVGFMSILHGIVQTGRQLNVSSSTLRVDGKEREREVLDLFEWGESRSLLIPTRALGRRQLSRHLRARVLSRKRCDANTKRRLVYQYTLKIMYNYWNEIHASRVMSHSSLPRPVRYCVKIVSYYKTHRRGVVSRHIATSRPRVVIIIIRIGRRLGRILTAAERKTVHPNTYMIYYG